MAPGRMRRQRVFRRHRAEGHSHHGIRARRERVEHARGAADVVRESDPHALALADPVGLHRAHAIRPSRHARERIEQILGVIRDLEVVHRNFAPLDRRAGTPAAAIDDLLIGKHRLVHGIPVHDARLQVRDASFQHAQEQPLIPAVVIRKARRDFAAPIERESQRLQLRLHGRDVVERPFRGRHPVRHRRVLRGQSERIPAHRLKHVPAVHAHEPADHIADGVIADMTHVQASARIGEHRQTVIFLAARVLGDFEALVLVPVALCLGLDGGRFISFLHGYAAEYLKMRTRRRTAAGRPDNNVMRIPDPASSFPGRSMVIVGRFHVGLGLATVSGCLWFLACTPFDWSAAAWVAAVPMLAAVDRAPSYRRALFLGWWAGVVETCGGFYWLIDTTQRFAGFPWSGPPGARAVCAARALIFLLFTAAVCAIRRRSPCP